MTAAVRGRVELANRAGEVGRLVRSGEPVFLGNAVKSGPDSGLQLMLLDQTTFTIGPDSEMTIDEFVYDPASSAGKVTASVAKGVFRFVTGKVAQKDPASMNVRMPTGVIGIRGTIAMGSVERPDPLSLAGLKQQIVLVGPGSNVDGKDRVGAILLSTGNGGVVINRPGFGSQLGEDGRSWGTPVRFTPEMIAALRLPLSPLPPPGSGAQQAPGTAGQATNIAGASATQARTEVSQINLLGDTILFANTVDMEANNQQVRDSTIGGVLPPPTGQPGTPPIPDVITNIPDGTTSFGQLRSTSGTYNFTQTGLPVSNGSGTYNLFLNVDAGARQFAAAGSRLEINTAFVSGVAVPTPIDFTLTPADQSVSISFESPGNSSGDFVGSVCGASMTCNVRLQVTALNVGGNAAANLQQQLSVFDDQSVFLFGGSGLAMQQPGLVTDPAPILNGTSTFDQLRSVSSGQFFYSQSNVPLGANDNYAIFANIDFGARTFGGGNSRVDFSGSNFNGTFFLSPNNYSAANGQAVFAYAFNNGMVNTSVVAQPQNVNNTVALQLKHSVEIQVDFGLGVVSVQGNGTTGNRTPGMVPLPP